MRRPWKVRRRLPAESRDRPGTAWSQREQRISDQEFSIGQGIERKLRDLFLGPAIRLTRTNTRLTPAAGVGRIAWICHTRVLSYPQNALRKSSTVCLVGDVAVKFAGSTGGKGACGWRAAGELPGLRQPGRRLPAGQGPGAGAGGGSGRCAAGSHAALATARTERHRVVRSCIQFLSDQFAMLIPEL